MEARERMPKLRTAMAIMVSTRVNPLRLRRPWLVFMSDILFLPSGGTSSVGVLPDAAGSTHEGDSARSGNLAFETYKDCSVQDVQAGVIRELARGGKFHEGWAACDIGNADSGSAAAGAEGHRCIRHARLLHKGGLLRKRNSHDRLRGVTQESGQNLVGDGLRRADQVE